MLLRANPYPKITELFCRLPSLTLFYAARGYLSRKPVANIGTNYKPAQRLCVTLS